MVLDRVVLVELLRLERCGVGWDHRGLHSRRQRHDQEFVHHLRHAPLGFALLQGDSLGDGPRASLGVTFCGGRADGAMSACEWRSHRSAAQRDEGFAGERAAVSRARARHGKPPIGRRLREEEGPQRLGGGLWAGSGVVRTVCWADRQQRACEEGAQGRGRPAGSRRRRCSRDTRTILGRALSWEMTTKGRLVLGSGRGG